MFSYLQQCVFDERLEGLRSQIAPGPAPDRDGGLCRLAVAGHQHVGHFLQLGFADLISNLLLPLVELHAEAGRRQAVAYRPRVFGVSIGNRQDHDLDRRQPERERPGIVLDQQGDEPLETAENRPVDDHGPVLGVVGPDVLQVEALGHLVVELDRRALPLATDGVDDIEVDLRPVERAVPFVHDIGLTDRVEGTPELAFRMVPLLDRAHELGRAGRELHLRLEPEIAIDALHEPEQALDFLADLRLHHEAVPVVLAELPDAGQPRQHARRFVPVQRRLLVKANRQVAIAANVARVDQEVAGAVHRLEAHLFPLALDEEHVLRDSAASGPTSPTTPC